MQTIEANKAEILGYLAAEGNEYHYTKTRWRFYPKEGFSGRWHLIHYKQDALEFTNRDVAIQRRFFHLLENVYGPQRIRFGSMWRIRIRQKRMVSDLLRHSRLGCLEWEVPRAVINSEDPVKAAWCRGYADGDGTVEKSEIRLCSNNLAGLRGVRDVLQSLQINSSLRGPYSYRPYPDRFILAIGKDSLSRYSSLVGFNHPDKKKFLGELVRLLMVNPRDNSIGIP